MTSAQSFSDGLAAAVEKAARSIVSVDARNRIPATGVVWSAEGEILTADHAVQRDDNITVTLPDGTSHPATLKGRDPASDLALLKLDAKGLVVPEFGDVKVGHLVFAVGRPGDVQADLGSVVAVGGPVRGRRRNLQAYIQSSVTMYPGFSGGPLVDASGRVVGITSSALARGASLAVPVAVARSVADALRKEGRIKRGFLGVATQPVQLSPGLAAQVQQEIGLMLIGVEPDGPAAQGGLLQGDVLVAVGGQPITEIESLQDALGPETVGTLTPVKVIRGGEVKEVNVTIGARQ